MTSPTAPGSDLDTIVSRTRHLLLDFDGPVCSIFAGLPAATIAGRLRKILADQLRSTTFCESPHDSTYRQAGPWQAVLMPAASSVHPTYTKVRRSAVTSG